MLYNNKNNLNLVAINLGNLEIPIEMEKEEKKKPAKKEAPAASSVIANANLSQGHLIPQTNPTT